ncbi:alpha/beta hydrolase [Leptospira semungkisensis]|uniref:Alpha/beta hydrolase n=1 Tax=Leptospira semungkisensis TaxID=2484985 RepID=A0A4R9G1F3_9LEPT|nr:alpha/beta hydrolase [Leptospira semungkisensis]TGK05071.1 alpha/beta hydrolase [Leptospira semungkisensis]
MKNGRLYQILPIALLLLGCSSYEEMSLENDKAIERLKQSETFYQEYYQSGDTNVQPVHWLSTGCKEPKKENILVFVHGSPGNWVNYLRYLKDPQLLEKYCMFSVDRPGFGKSEGADADVNRQAQRILSSLNHVLQKREKPKRLVLLGHSYGGPVAARIASLEGNSFSHLLLLAAALDPESEEVRWYNKLAATKLGSWLLPTEWQHSNAEMLPLKGQLQDLLPIWKNINAKTIVVQGEEDGLVDPSNAAFIQKQFSPQAQVKIYLLPKEGHFLPWKNYDLIYKILMEITNEK